MPGPSSARPAAHLLPQNCYVCGWPKSEHPRENPRHTFWSNAQAAKDLAQEPQGDSGAEARYVAEYRPY
jgi:hypothetical protein